MDTIKPKELLNKSNKEIHQLISLKLLTSIIMIYLKKKEVKKQKAIAIQRLVAMKNSQAYAMYKNYVNCLNEDDPYIIIKTITLNERGELFIYGINRREYLDFVIEKDQISRTKDILIYAR